MKMAKGKGRKHFTLQRVCQSRMVMCGRDQYCEDVYKATEIPEQVNCRECLKGMAYGYDSYNDKEFLKYYNQESKERVARIKAGEETESDRWSVLPLSFDVQKMLQVMTIMKSM